MFFFPTNTDFSVLQTLWSSFAFKKIAQFYLLYFHFHDTVHHSQLKFATKSNYCSQNARKACNWRNSNCEVAEFWLSLRCANRVSKATGYDFATGFKLIFTDERIHYDRLLLAIGEWHIGKNNTVWLILSCWRSTMRQRWRERWLRGVWTLDPMQTFRM